ncbi:hypothetical protein [Saccharopolyspora hordei]|nr:hypothetical protein [Saccharopolyspora hordei]
MRAELPALTGTVTVDNALGLPALPGDDAAPLLTDGTERFQVWADGQGRHRVSAPSPVGEQTVVDDGTTTWTRDSSERSVPRTPHRLGRRQPGGERAGDLRRPGRGRCRARAGPRRRAG